MTALVRWDPLRELESIDRRMRRFFDFPSLVPPTDVYETEKELVLELEVPGFTEKELDIELSDHTLCVKGTRREETEKTEERLRLHERLATEFERRFVLPHETDTKHVGAAYANGVLTLHVPKTGTEAPRKVEIAKK
jgi:HSP20 family protein